MDSLSRFRVNDGNLTLEIEMSGVSTGKTSGGHNLHLVDENVMRQLVHLPIRHKSLMRNPGDCGNTASETSVSTTVLLLLIVTVQKTPCFVLRCFRGNGRAGF
jgi:hypothetical protein